MVAVKKIVEALRILSYADEFQDLQVKRENAVVGMRPRKDRRPGGEFFVVDSVASALSAHIPTEDIAAKWPVPQNMGQPIKYFHAR
jgi:hypothetical protein